LTSANQNPVDINKLIQENQVVNSNEEDLNKYFQQGVNYIPQQQEMTTTTTTQETNPENTLTIKHTAPSNNIASFNDAKTFPNIEFVIPCAMDEPLLLHDMMLGTSSTTFAAVINGEKQPNCTGERKGMRLHMEWIDKRAKTDEKYRNVLIKWLRFCYGEDQTFNADECPAALTVLLQMKLNCQDEAKGKIEAFMMETAKKNVESGAKMLYDCAIKYENAAKMKQIILTWHWQRLFLHRTI